MRHGVLLKIKPLSFKFVRIIDFDGKTTMSLKTERIFTINLSEIKWLNSNWVLILGKICFGRILKNSKWRLVLWLTYLSVKEIGGTKFIRNKN